MSEPEAITVTVSEPETTVGLLGAVVDHEKLDILGPKYFTDVRLEEIERRILAIEEMVWPLGK